MNIAEISRIIVDVDDPTLGVNVFDLAGANALAVRLVDSTGAGIDTLPISGTVTVTANNLDIRDITYVTDSILVRGIQTPNGDSAMDDTNDALRVNVVACASATQYTEGDTDASITGTAIMFESDTGTNLVS